MWSFKIGSDGSDEALGVYGDNNGSLYITGNFGGLIDFDFGDEVYELSPDSDSAIFILKIDTDGNFLWAQSYGMDY